MPSLHAVAVRLVTVLLPLSVVFTTYLYLYPLAHLCSFPAPAAGSQTWLESCAFEDDALRQYFSKPNVAPFRLLALGDPQLEGDTSLPSEVAKTFRGFASLQEDITENRWSQALQSVQDAVQDLRAEATKRLLYARKNLDLIGNDYYLAHIYRTLRWSTDPSHVTVLGDLLGSQWIDDDEFEKRAGRFWRRVFNGAEPVPQGVLHDYTGEENKQPEVQVLGSDASWRRRIINVAGNHDIGYAGDIVRSRVERFERAFGPVNGDLHFRLPTEYCNSNLSSHDIPTLRLVVLNSMNLDSPANDDELQQESYKFINSVIEHSEPVGTHHMSTILLTHIPLHKEAGICVDDPYFSYFPDHNGGGVEEQNMLSKDISLGATLQGMFGKSPDVERSAAGGLGRDGIILTGHDHEGCDVYHYVNHEKQEWMARKYSSAEAGKARHNGSIPGLREVTVRSMMGEFGGNAALVSAWWDEPQGKWQIEVAMCALGVQHIWWAIHVLDLVTLVVCIVAIASTIVRSAVRTSSTAPSNGNVLLPRNKEVHTDTQQGTSSTLVQKKKSSAFSKRMQQTLDEGSMDQSSDSDGQRQRTSRSSSKRRKRKPGVRLKSEN